MHIKEITLEGFKSYAQRTVVSGFDAQFNAITGLNGTGKSNILDSICFVLGISNLSQVRVGNLQELVYKQGQAGVTKASVMITFSNNDPSTSPIGYESSKEITVTRIVAIGGKNKYLINGSTVQQQQVQNFFHSVQLNVNNPHFLIMQGRITKVLNMKPMETLGMIEEAAGTRMFETKKQAAQKTIEKKQQKVDEITKCIAEEISPTLENLRVERTIYHAWQANNAEYERTERFMIGFEFYTANAKVLSAEADKQAMLKEQDELQRGQDASNEAAEVCAGKIEEIERIRGENMEGELKVLKEKETDLSKALVKTNTLFTNQKETLTAEKDSLSALQRQHDAATATLKQKNVELETCSAELVVKETAANTAEQQYVKEREKYQNACAGVTDENCAELLSIPEQVGTWEKKEREAGSTLQNCQQKAKYATDKLKELQKSTKTMSGNQTSMQKDVDSLKAAVTEREGKISQLKSQHAALALVNEADLRKKVSGLQSKIAELKDTVANTGAGMEARLAFQYRDPEKGFDRSRVKGMVASLFSFQRPEVATALEITAGGKLYQVVVDNEKTGAALLSRGELKKRVTFLPVNKMQTRCTDTIVINKAKQIAQSMGGTAHLALELIQFDESVRSAMEYCFGTTIVCSSSAIAKAVTFDKSIKTRTVTLEGDTYDPSGTLTGGSNNNLGTLLGKLHELSSAKRSLTTQEGELQTQRKQLEALEKFTAQLKDLQAELELKQHALKLCEEKMADSSYSQSMAQIKEVEGELTAIEQEMKTAQELQARAKSELQKLKTAEKDNKKRREAAMKDMEKGVKESQKHANAVKAEMTTCRNRRDALQAEIKACMQELQTIKEQRQVAESAVTRLSEEIEALNTKLTQIKNDFEQAKNAVAAKNAELNKASKEIKELEKEKARHLKEAQDKSLEARKLSHKLKEWEKETKECSKQVNAMLKQNPWIEKEKEFFGQAGSDFDFAAKDVTQCARRHKELKTEQDKLAKKINKKVMGMIENAEKEYEELNRKREVILNDKSKIESVIEELDVKKAQALQTTWQKVNKDFGSIFSMLLPGVTAKLEPPEGQTVNEGLEVRVAFNNVWKESLTELSGGQRSLLALSLILALLLFKPAPMYILDEVDAALDLSHTQNIGMMLRTHFSTSQFIVVSLKEGMFNNANVIFRTRFVDGVSAVTRTVAGNKMKASITAAAASVLQHHSNASNNVAADSEDAEAPQKKKGKTVSNAASKASRQLTEIDV